MINLIGLFLLTLTAEVFVAKSFIKPFIPIYGKFVVGKNVGGACFIGAILYNIGYLMFIVYTALGLNNMMLTTILYAFISIGGLIYSITLFKHYTHNVIHSILLSLFGGWMFILGKKTKLIFGGLFHQMWDFEFQQEAGTVATSAQPQAPVQPQEQTQEPQPEEQTQEQPQEQPVEKAPDNAEPSIASEPVEDFGKDLFPDEPKNEPVELESTDEPIDIAAFGGNKEINLDEGFDI